MSASGERVRNQITEEAAGWFVTNREGLDAQERGMFAAWLKASPLHVEEYLAVSVISRDLRAACEFSQGTVDDLLERAQVEDEVPVHRLWPRFYTPSAGGGTRRWSRAAVLIAGFAILTVAILRWWSFTPVVPDTSVYSSSQRFETRHGEQQVYRLTDRSVLYMNSDSTVTVSYSNQERSIVLQAGEAYFAVAHDPGRPFKVVTAGAEVRAIGTRFDVRLDQGSTVVTVAEGRVTVGPAAVGAAKRLPQLVEVGANEQVRVASEEWPPPAAALVDVQRTIAWLHRNITFNREPLERVTLEFNRYASKPIEIATPELRGLEITGNFATDDTAAFIAFLRSLDGVRVEETSTYIRVSRD